MTFSQAVSTCLSQYATFSGRAARPEFWWFILFQVIANILAGILDSVLFGSAGFPLLGTIVGLGLFLPSLAVAVRRLHDTARSGWWILLGLIPVIGILVLIYFYIQPGKDDQNPFGPRPA